MVQGSWGQMGGGFRVESYWGQKGGKGEKGMS